MHASLILHFCVGETRRATPIEPDQSVPLHCTALTQMHCTALSPPPQLLFHYGMRPAYKKLPLCRRGLIRREAFTITTEPVVPQSAFDSLSDKYDRTRQEKENLAVEAAVLRNSVKVLAREQHVSSEKINLRGCIGEILPHAPTSAARPLHHMQC